jgi:hypothetical protein
MEKEASGMKAMDAFKKTIAVIIAEIFFFSQVSWCQTILEEHLDVPALSGVNSDFNPTDFGLMLASSNVVDLVIEGNKTIQTLGNYRYETLDNSRDDINNQYLSYTIINVDTGVEVFLQEISRIVDADGVITYQENLNIEKEYYFNHTAAGEEELGYIIWNFFRKSSTIVITEAGSSDLGSIEMPDIDISSAGDLASAHLAEEFLSLQGQFFEALGNATVTETEFIFLNGQEQVLADQTMEIIDGKLRKLITTSGDEQDIVEFDEDGRPVSFNQGALNVCYEWEEDGISKITLEDNGYTLEREVLDRGEGYVRFLDTSTFEGNIISVVDYYDYYGSDGQNLVVSEVKYSELLNRWSYRALSQDSLESLQDFLSSGESLDSWNQEYRIEMRDSQNTTSDWIFYQSPDTLRVHYKGQYLATLSQENIDNAYEQRVSDTLFSSFPLGDYFIGKYADQLGDPIPISYDDKGARDQLQAILQNKFFEEGKTLDWDPETEEMDRFIALALAYAENYFNEDLRLQQESLPGHWFFKCGDLILGGLNQDQGSSNSMHMVAGFRPILIHQDDYRPVLNPGDGGLDYIPLTQNELSGRHRISYFFSNKEDYRKHFETMYGNDDYKQLTRKHTILGGAVDRLSAPHQSMSVGADESSILPHVFLGVDVLKWMLSAGTWGTSSSSLSIYEHKAYSALADMLITQSDYIKANWTEEEILSAVDLVQQYNFGKSYALTALTLTGGVFPEDLVEIFESEEVDIDLAGANIELIFDLMKVQDEDLTVREFAMRVALEQSLPMYEELYNLYSDIFTAQGADITPSASPISWWEIAAESFTPVSVAVTLATLGFAKFTPLTLAPELATASSARIWASYMFNMLKPHNWWLMTTSGSMFGGLAVGMNVASSLWSGRDIDTRVLNMSYSMGFITGMAFKFFAIPDAAMYRWGSLGRRLATNPGGLGTMFLSEGGRTFMRNAAPKMLLNLDRIASTIGLSYATNFAVNGILDASGIELSEIGEIGVKLGSLFLTTRFLFPAHTGLIQPPNLPVDTVLGTVRSVGGKPALSPLPGQSMPGTYSEWVGFMFKDYYNNILQILGG